MPKRDLAYMDGQRDLIARAAFECLLENGVAETSIRDICTQAGVSIGAFYTHFSDKQQAIFAACGVDLAANDRGRSAATWREYVDAVLLARDELAQMRTRKRLRLTYQFVAELTLYEGSFPGWQATCDKYLADVRGSLAKIHAAGEIEMPLGLEQTTTLHTKLYYGAIHMLMVNHELDPETEFNELLAGMAIVAGLRPSAG